MKLDIFFYMYKLMYPFFHDVHEDYVYTIANSLKVTNAIKYFFMKIISYNMKCAVRNNDR